MGENFYLMDNQILCTYDYEERRIFASMNLNTGGPNVVAEQLKQRVQKVDLNTVPPDTEEVSSGYDSV